MKRLLFISAIFTFLFAPFSKANAETLINCKMINYVASWNDGDSGPKSPMQDVIYKINFTKKEIYRENLSTGKFVLIKDDVSFTDNQISWNNKYETMVSYMVINRLSGIYTENIYFDEATAKKTGLIKTKTTYNCSATKQKF
jgi:hypothetical protein